MLELCRFLQHHWQVLINDIETDTLNQKITERSIRDCMAKILKPGHELAEFIKTDCATENWGGTITRIWPNTNYLDVIVTGSMAQYIPPLDYYSGGLPFASVMYGSPESWFGLNLNPMCKSSEVSYFEILPQEPDSDSQLPKLVDLDDVKLARQSMTPFNRACIDTELVTFSGSLGSTTQIRSSILSEERTC